MHKSLGPGNKVILLHCIGRLVSYILIIIKTFYKKKKRYFQFENVMNEKSIGLIINRLLIYYEYSTHNNHLIESTSYFCLITALTYV